MSLIWVLLLLVLFWWLNAYIKAYNKIVDELREIRIKCVREGNASSLSTSQPAPLTDLKDQFETLLKRIKAFAA